MASRINAPFQNPQGPTGSKNPYVAWNMRMVFPGQSTVVSRYTGQAETIGRGPGYFAGFCTWFPKDENSMRELERFFFQMEGGINYTDLQLPRRYDAQEPMSASRIFVSAARIFTASRDVEVTMDIDSGTPNIIEGDFVNIGDRLYRVRQGTNVGQPNQMYVLPMAVPAVGAEVEKNFLTVKARASSSDQGDLLTEGWIHRPVTFDWVEVV